MNASPRLFAAWRRAWGIDRDAAGDDALDSAGDAATEGADPGAPSGDATATAFLDSVHLPRSADAPDDERVVRPSLAYLFRMAVGPGADYYAPRFLEYERVGQSFPSWNWAALCVPAVWAIYRRLWLPAMAFAVWPFLALALHGVLEPYVHDSGASAIAGAAFLVWLGPGLVAATIANTLVYRRARRLVGTAEARRTRPEKAARWLSQRTVIAPIPAALTGAATILLVLHVMIPSLQATFADQVVRSRIAASLAAMQPLQRQLEEWFVSSSPSDAPDFAHAQAPLAAEFHDSVNVSLTSGRVRLALGSLAPELSGRSILLAPTLDRRQQVRWICVPVDIPARYLPRECRQG